MKLQPETQPKIFSLPWTTLDNIPALYKAQHIPDGARWITVHPPGHEKGQPVLVQPHPTHKDVWRVIGGAGGKLNYLKLRGLKSNESYREQLEQKADAKKKEKQQQRQRDKEQGITQNKSTAKADIAQERRTQQRRFIESVAKIVGWKDSDIQFDAAANANLSPKAYNRAQRKHHAALLKKAKEIVDQRRQQLLASAQQGELLPGDMPGDMPIDIGNARPDQVGVADLDPVRPFDAGLGLSHQFAERASAQAGGANQLRQELSEHLQQDEKRKRTGQPASLADEIQQELKDWTPPALPPPNIDEQHNVRDTIALLGVEKLLRLHERDAKNAIAKIEKSDDIEEIKAYNIRTTHNVTTADVLQDIQALQDTDTVVSFMSMVNKEAGDGIPPEQALGRHIATGASNAFSAISTTLGGHALLDRSVIDVLGIAGAAQVLAKRLQQDLSPQDLETTRRALGEYHVHHARERANDAMKQARVWLDAADHAQAAHLDPENGGDLVELTTLHRQRLAALAEARGLLGTALGEFESAAALNLALQSKNDRTLTVSLGNIDRSTAYAQLRAIGIQPEHLELRTINGEQVADIDPAGFDRLTAPIDWELLQQQRAAAAIISGQHDEPDWLPAGFARRQDLNGVAAAGATQRLAQPFRANNGLEQAIRDYFGGRVADGDNPRDILADAISQPFIASNIPAPQRDEYVKTLSRLLPLTRTRRAMDADSGGAGKLVTENRPIDEHQALLDTWADDFVTREYGAQRSAFAKQDIQMDDRATEAMHRALSKTPEGVAAYKPIGDLTAQDQQAIRLFFAKHIAKQDSDSETSKALAQLQRQEPQKEMMDMFGDMSINPEWSAWQTRVSELQQQVAESNLDWPQYVEAMGERENAYAAVQDMIRSHVAKHFCDAYNSLQPDQPLKLGRTNIREHLRHADALDPALRRTRASEQASLDADMRYRNNGKFASGSIREERAERRTAREGFKQAQMDMLGTAIDAQQEIPLSNDERYTLGHVAEQRLAGLAAATGGRFKAGQPIELRPIAMSGRYVNQQRAIKMLIANKRLALAQGVGSGKTNISLGAFTQLHADGKVKRGIFAVPSIVQGQFNGEALRSLDPTKHYKWHATPGANRDERIAALKDPDTHFVVTTHAALRDDLLFLGAQHAGITPQQLSTQLDAMTGAQRAQWMRDLMQREGIRSDFMTVDEGHNLLNRQGKKNSSLANVLDAVSANSPYYINATADPVKNSVDEAFDVLQKMDPSRHTDRNAFMRRYGPNTQTSKDALRLELQPYLYPGRIDPGVSASRTEERVPVSPEQGAALAALDKATAAMRASKLQGRVNMQAAKQLAPDIFKNTDPTEHETLARNVGKYVGVLKHARALQILQAGAPKLERAAEIAKERRAQQQPGIIFAHHKETIRALQQRLERDGHRVAVLTGEDSAEQKDAIRRAFSPDGDTPPTADILLASDAGAVGLNAQRGRWLVQYDTPQTAMLHAQRDGRIYRLGQKNNVDLIDLVADHPIEHSARERLAKKYMLRDMMTNPLEGIDDSSFAAFLRAQQQEQPL